MNSNRKQAFFREETDGYDRMREKGWKEKGVWIDYLLSDGRVEVRGEGEEVTESWR